jgi:hypothetical protein
MSGLLSYLNGTVLAFILYGFAAGTLIKFKAVNNEN